MRAHRGHGLLFDDEDAYRKFGDYEVGTRFVVLTEDESTALEAAPDFAAMTPDERRAWLDERGYRNTFRNGEGWHAALYRDPDYTDCIAETLGRVMCICSVEPTAILALCENVAAIEDSR